MKLDLAIKIGKDCNVKTIGQTLQVIFKNKKVLFEYDNEKAEIQELIKEIKLMELSMEDRIDKLVLGDKSRVESAYKDDLEWWQMVC